MMMMIDDQGFEPAEKGNQAENVDGPPTHKTRKKKGSGASTLSRSQSDVCALFKLYHEMPDKKTNGEKYSEWHDKARRFLTENNIIPAPVKKTKASDLPN